MYLLPDLKHGLEVALTKPEKQKHFHLLVAFRNFLLLFKNGSQDLTEP